MNILEDFRIQENARYLDRFVKKCYNGNENTLVYDTVGRRAETRTENGDNIFRVLYGYFSGDAIRL